MQLLEIKKQFEQCKKDIRDHHNLLEKREVLFQNLLFLKESIESKLIQMHLSIKSNKQKAENLKSQILEDKEKLSILKNQLQHIDAHIELLGEDKQVLFDRLERDLITKIHELFPDTKKEYQAIRDAMATVHQQAEWLAGQKNLIMPFFTTLKEGSSIPLKTRFVDFFFGNHPKALLAKVIYNAISLGDKIYPEVKEKQIKQFLEKFLAEAKKTWNKKLYQGKFTEFFEEFNGLVAGLEEQINNSKQQIDKLEKAIEKWVESYCNGQKDE